MLVSLILFPIAVAAQTVVISSINNTNPKDVSSISAECQVAADGQRMTCNFVQVSVGLKKQPEAVAGEVEKALKDFDAGEMAKACKEGRKEDATLRARLARTPDVSQRMKAILEEWFRRHDAFCDKPTRESARAFLSYGMEKETRICRVWSNPWQETFTRSLGGKWVSNRGPAGICDVVILSILEAENPKKAPWENYLWTYSTQKIMTDKGVGNALCLFDEAKVTYSWKSKEFDRSCEFIEFGF